MKTNDVEEFGKPLFIWVCYNPDCELNPFIATQGECDLCHGSNVRPMFDGTEGGSGGPIRADSEQGLELCRLLKIFEVSHG